MNYGDRRWWEMSRSNEPIPADLQELGWHYCPDFDQELWQVQPWGVCQWCGLRVEPEFWRQRLVWVLQQRSCKVLFGRWLEKHCLDDVE